MPATPETAENHPSPFIVGMPRSGTTLLRLMLDAHPDLAIPLETHFLRPLLHDELAPEITRDAFYHGVVDFFIWPDFHLSADEFHNALLRLQPFTLPEGLRCFYSFYAKRFGKKRWGDKTPPYGFIMRKIHSLLPEAHFIHVIRDGRDTALSHKSTYFWRYSNFREHAREWRDRIQQFREQGASCPYMEVRYEDLVSDPTAVLRHVCEFIDLPYRSEMERYHEAASSRMDELADLPRYPPGHLYKRERHRIFRLTSKPPVKTQVGRWRKEMLPDDVASYEAEAGDRLEELGYELFASGATEAPEPSKAKAAAPAIIGALRTRVKSVSRTWVKLPYREASGRHMIRELDHWKYFELCKVSLECGVTGFGETMPFYTWSSVTDEDTYRVLGRDPAEMMWDDTIGPGLQQALFDAVGKARDVPIHRLLGRKVRDRCPVGWWAIDMPADDWIAEAREAMAQGYTSMKTKGRPWFDFKQQCRTLQQGLPSHFRVGFDFNGSLLTADRARDYLSQTSSFPHISVYEEPIPDDDIAGYESLRGKLGLPTALHSHRPPVLTSIGKNLCDMFVISEGGASAILRQGRAAADAGKPFWLQQVGSAITAAYSLHFGAVLSHAQHPAATCHQLFADQLIDPEIEVESGTAPVPEAPGIGVQLDEEAVMRYRTDPVLEDPYPVPGQLIAIRWPSGKFSYYAHTRQYWEDFMGGRLPSFADGVHLESSPNDGSRDWKDLQGRAALGGVHISAGF
jgi:L-alanine-DL-glutamate epimerase-like enolase superfamily enzyme